MGVIMTRRQRLSSGVIAAAAFASALGWWSQADAQNRPQSTPPIDCTEYRRAEGIPNNPSQRNAQLGLPPGINTALSTVARFNPANGDTTLLRAAMSDCENVRRNRTVFNVQAYLCLADGSLKLAQASRENRETLYREAHCRYDVAAALATTQGARAAAERGRAHEGRGQTLMALNDLSPNTSQGAQYRDGAVTAYSAAIAAQGTAERYRQRSLGYLQQGGGMAQARDDITTAWNTRTDGSLPPEPALALALVAVGTANGVDSGARPGVNDSATLLAHAAQVAPNSVSAHAALGLARYNRREFGPARDALIRATSATAVDDTNSTPGSRNYPALARYTLAMIEVDESALAGRQPNWSTVFEYANAAVGQAGSSDVEHRRLRCISYVMKGWGRRETPQDYCNFNGTAEGDLLRSMFHFRRAQYLNPLSMADTPARRAYIAAINDARSALDNGFEAAMRQPNPDATATWQGYTPAFNVRQVIEFGRSFIAQNCPVPQNLHRNVADVVNREGRPFFQNYGLFNCNATQAN